MKLKLALAFVLCASLVYASPSDSLHLKKVPHHFQLLIGNYTGESFLTPNGSNTLKPYYAPPGQINYGTINENIYYYKPSFVPMYSYAVGFNYTADLSKHVGISTGVNYFAYGYIVQGTYDPCPYCMSAGDANPDEKYKRVIFISSLQLPLHLLVYQQCKHGKFVFSAGPEFYLPANTFGTETFKSVAFQLPETSSKIHYHVNGIDFLQGGSMGFALGLGYEKTLSKKLAIELLPDVHLVNMVPFDFEGQGKGIYQNYIFNAAVGLSTYLTFTK